MDRFMVKLRVEYPTREAEGEIIERVGLSEIGSDGSRPGDSVQNVVGEEGPASGDALLEARTELNAVTVDRKIRDYVVELVFATREPEAAGLSEFKTLLEFGTSPRASIFLTRAARAFAYLNGRDFVLPDDVKAMAYPVLRHRLRTTYEADARGIDSDALIDMLLATVPAP